MKLIMVEINIKVPDSLIKIYWDKINFERIEEYINNKRIKELEKKYYNKKTDSYGVFNNSLEAINFLTRNRWK